jgi:hypothetical protein
VARRENAAERLVSRRNWTEFAERLRRLDERCRARGPIVDRFDIEDVRRCLDLPTIKYSELAGPTGWLAGGALLRWILGDAAGDFDFYFASRAALRETALQLSRRGCTVRRASRRDIVHDYTRHKLTVIARQLRRLPHPAAPPPFENWNGAEARAWIEDVVQADWLLTLEFQTRDADLLQLIGGFIQPTPADTLSTFDYSICRLAMDDRSIYVGRRTLRDLADRRLRLERMGHPRLALRRLLKYMWRGFTPDRDTVIEVARALRSRRPALAAG